MARQKRPTIPRNINPDRTRKIQHNGGSIYLIINKFKSQHNETIKSSQFHKLVRQQNENAEEWMGRLRLTALGWIYKEIDR